MLRVFIELIQFLFTNLQLLTSTVIFVFICIWLAKSIKKHAKIYYAVLSIPFFLVAVPFTVRLFGGDIGSLTGAPIIGQILRDYIHWGTFGHPLFIIVMYMGALDIRQKYVKRLMSIRKELCIIAGFPVLTHMLVRTFNNLPGGLLFFTNNEEFMATNRVMNEVGAGFTSFSFVLGILIFAVFLPLWITSFDPVRKRMNVVSWKKLQRWSYLFYATLFIHAMTIAVGGIINSPNPRPDGLLQVIERQAQVSGGSGRVLPRGFVDYEVPRQTRRYLQVASLLLIYGSYLYLRVRKARRSRVKVEELRKIRQSRVDLH